MLRDYFIFWLLIYGTYAQNVKIRGLCENIRSGPNYDIINYQGIDKDTWIIGQINENGTILKNIGHSMPDLSGSDYPFGLRKWNLTDPSCPGIRELIVTKV